MRPENNRGRNGARLWIERLIGGLAMVAGTAAPLGVSAADAAQAPASTATPRPYMRVLEPDTNTVALQIALRRFGDPGDASRPTIWLAGVAHIGETNYFEALQSFLAEQSLVLFEGVGYAEAKAWKASGGGEPDTGSLQSTLAASLGLAFQLESIDYDRKNFRNSDLSLAQITELMTQRIQEGGLDETARANPEFVALLAAIEGSSWVGAIMHMGARLLGSSPKLKAMTRLLLIEVLGRIEGDLSQMEGLPKDVQELLRVLIQARNATVMTDLKQALAQDDRPASIAVFYGAAHMDDMEQRLRRELGYVDLEERWMTAIAVQPARSGLNPADVAMIKGLVQWQMKTLRDAMPNRKSTTP